MSARRILTLFFAAFVLAEARWHVQKREISSICDPMSGNSSKILCFCIKDSRHYLDQIKSADCFLTVENLKSKDHAWDSFDELKTAMKITLTNSRGIALQYIPTHALKHLENLVQLDIKYGNIEKLHRYSFANLSNLEEISLKDSQIQVLEKHSFAHHRDLIEIKLDKNNIVEINRDVFIDLPSLEKLYLTENQITTIHDRAFMYLGNLKELEINMNKLFSLNSETFSGLKNLQKLDLSGNNLEVIGDDTFFPLKNLISLNLEGNKIQMIDNKAFKGLSKLLYLSLSHNKLPNINDEVFLGLNALITLSLRGNEIKDLNYKALDPLLPNFYGDQSHLDVEDNIFTCDCKLDWFMQLMNRTQSKTLKNALENLKCLPDSTLRDQWNKLEEAEKNSAQTFDPEEPSGTDYEYYDESQLNGKLFYTDVKDLIGCVKNKSVTETTTQKIAMLVTAAKETKVTSHTTPTVLTDDRTDAAMTKITTTLFDTRTRNTVDKRTTAPTNHGVLDLSEIETTPKSKDIVDNEIDHDKKPNSYTTARLVNVSAKPINVYENMAADEAKPDKIKAQRSHQEELKDNVTDKAHTKGVCVALILLTCAIILFH